MTNGFYTSNKLNKRLKKSFIKDAIGLSYNISCQSKYTDGIEDRHRTIDKRLTLNETISYLLANKTAILDCIDRYEYNRGAIPKELCEYEIGFHTTKGTNNGWLLLYIFVNENAFKTLIEKYQLKLIER